MLPKQNKNTKSKSKDVQEELEAEKKQEASQDNLLDSILKTGNENAGKILLDAAEEAEKSGAGGRF